MNGFNPIICPSCGNDEKNVVLQTWGKYEIRECPQCQLIFSWPMIPGDLEFYQKYPVYDNPNIQVSKNAYLAIAKKKFNRRLLQMVPPQGKMLDIGCGNGAWVKVAMEAGIDAWGIDMNEQSINFGRKVYMLDDTRLLIGRVEDLYQDHKLTSQLFDLITLFEVIEHVADPSALIRTLTPFLKPGGFLALSCPNEARIQWGGRIFADYPPHHLTRWKPQTMIKFMERHGFTPVTISYDTSLRDCFWTYCVNRLARKKRSRQASAANPGVAVKTSWVRQYLRCHFLFLDSLFRASLIPFDLILRGVGIGTMGMQLVFRKEKKPMPQNV